MWVTIVDSGWNLWVWLVGMVSRRKVWFVGESMGVVRMYRCGYNNDYFSYSTCISSFFDSSIPISLIILKMFFRSCNHLNQTASWLDCYMIVWRPRCESLRRKSNRQRGPRSLGSPCVYLYWSLQSHFPYHGRFLFLDPIVNI